VKFDALTRAFATGTSRRTAIKGLFGGAVGVAVATTRLDRAGAQSCTPETVLESCPLPDECTTAVCVQEGETWVCAYEGGCGGDYCCGGTCQACCDSSDCGGCDICDSGTCISGCTDCQECEGEPGVCVDLSSGGVCCEGTWIPDGQCCNTGDCVGPVDTFCSSVTCLEYTCTVVPECPDDQQCCGYGAEGAYCAECCDNDDCYIAGSCSTCEEGWCTTPECCEDSDCYGCEVCGQDYQCHPLLCEFGSTCCDGHECIPEEDCCRGAGDSCGLLDVTAAGGSDQLDCCDGLVCCENWNSQYPICAECCNDWDCPKGAWCNEGWCDWPDEECEYDKECPKGTCCCKDGSCSGKCCHHHHPKPHPKPYPPKPAPAPAPVTSLPATGAGESSDSTGLFGAAALGAAAALYAAKKMRETPEASTEE
jgi:LPXTG-motif cell wall-anchored protein